MAGTTGRSCGLKGNKGNKGSSRQLAGSDARDGYRCKSIELDNPGSCRMLGIAHGLHVMGGMAATSSQRRISIHHVSRARYSLGKPFAISTAFRLTAITRCSNFSG